MRLAVRQAAALAFLQVLLLGLALAAPAAAQGAWPALTGRVVDTAGVLSPSQAAALERRLAAHEQATSNQVVVATVPSLDGSDAADYANGLFRAWRLGQQGRDNGVLLLVAPSEREVRIEVGYGLEGVLTDALASRIIRSEILPRFRAGDLPGGIAAGTDAVLAAIDGSYAPVAETPSPRDFAPLLLFAAWVLFVIWHRSRRRRGRAFGVPRPHRRAGRGGYWGAGGPGGFGGRGGGGSGGGGFRGGGGSSGGGGASGRW